MHASRSATAVCRRGTLRPVDLVFGNDPSLLQRRAAPFLPGRQRHHRIHVGARPAPTRRRRRCESATPPAHTWRRRRRTCRTGTARRRRSARGNRPRSPRCGAHWPCASGVSARLLDRPPHVHRAIAAQRLRSPRAFRRRSRAHAPAPRRRPATAAAPRKSLGQIFEDRERFPDAHVAVDQHRHLAGPANRADTLLEVRARRAGSPLRRTECRRPSSRSTAGTTRRNSSCCR